MHVQAKSVIAILAGVWLVGCAPGIEGTPAPPSCAVGSRCTLEGTLYVFRGTPASVAELRTANGCNALAFAEADYRRYEKRRGQRVRVSGTAYSNGTAENVASVTIRDRMGPRPSVLRAF